ncbi:ubiquinol-cytochrome c reductase iron-sulfur subunit [Pilimelia terevasa]|uniref:Cytochrome bc1 complex Rieske iron-sulfur subunit n=1 Tax=Pilimelia terevasa TaxID=53372 RepID=A0A8J3BN99_9ACTN|nr:Rieske 2Fe-2S domain-containing protein [Pilimelia terevasa]GGK26603.1 ubiquinol-cytochrome c reductase iron-sulfur subunit [Pilimelia terevasa]
MTVVDNPHGSPGLATAEERSRFETIVAGAREDGVEIVHYEPPFPAPGTRGERRLQRIVAGCFLTTGGLATAFLVTYIWWPWEYDRDSLLHNMYTPVLGLTLGLALVATGFGIMIWGKKLIPHEVSIQERHDGPSSDHDRSMATSTLLYMGDEMGLKRRPLLGLSLLAGVAPVGLAAAAPLIGGLIKDPHKPVEGGTGSPLMTTAWGPGIRLTREDGTPIRPEDISTGGQLTVFPGVPEGHTNVHADSPTLLIHLRGQDMAELRDNLTGTNVGATWGDFVAYSKICTHAGCPASLFEQQTNRLLCPCHQSQFLVTDNAKPVFGPATRRLPMLHISVDDEGYFVATSDYKVAIGPGFWERP